MVIGVTNYLNSTAEDKNIGASRYRKTLGEEFKISYRSIDGKNFNINEITKFAKDKNVILALNDSHLTLIQRVLYTQFKQSINKLMLISLRTPYDIIGQEHPDCHYAIYEYTKNSINALIKVLKGYPAHGVCPVKLVLENHKLKNTQVNNLLVRKAIHYIKENFSKQISLNDLAEELNVSVEHLSRLIKKETNLNFSDYLISERINQAMNYLKRLRLEFTNRSLCGFSDSNYFSKRFKRSSDSLLKNTGTKLR